jgi:hypothetical protein
LQANIDHFSSRDICYNIEQRRVIHCGLRKIDTSTAKPSMAELSKGGKSISPQSSASTRPSASTSGVRITPTGANC